MRLTSGYCPGHPSNRTVPLPMLPQDKCDPAAVLMPQYLYPDLPVSSFLPERSDTVCHHAHPVIYIHLYNSKHQNLWHILTASSSDTSVRLSSELSFLLPRFLLSAVFRLLWTHPICLNYCIQSVLLLPEALYLQVHTTSDMFSFSFFSPLFF